MDIRRMFTYDYNSSISDGESVANLADVAYWDGSGVKTCSIDNWASSLGTPIGVVVIPSGILPDGMARIVSLHATNRSGAANSHSTMTWGPTNIDTSLTEYTKVPVTDSNQQVSGSSNFGYLPSDNFSAKQSIVDPDAYYYYDDVNNQVPSPYSNGGLNLDYCMKIAGNNLLGDFNGLSNTETLVGLGTDYTAANAAYSYTDGVSDCVWYLPAAGELGFLIARFNTINNVISQLGGVTVPSNIFWSSSEYATRYVSYFNTNNGQVGNYAKKKNSYHYVRPFCLLDISSGGSRLIAFKLFGITYYAEEGMTWGEWIESEYNRDGFIIENNIIYYPDGIFYVGNSNYTAVSITDIISSTETYYHLSNSNGGVGD